ncbi:hypothetical protein [Nocardia sp. NBC_00511]|uniref:hypothetical protein n=1 Tax=Nocardia sp. NBC_00511 TaxID=2903591 RepID=UPI0030DE7B5E
MLRATSHELAALPAHLAPLLTPAEADALTAAADTYAATGAILEISSTPTATPDDYAETRSAWRTPLRLLLLTATDSDESADMAYADWVYWIAGGGLLVIPGTHPGHPAARLHQRALASGKFRELPSPATLRILLRVAACN